MRSHFFATVVSLGALALIVSSCASSSGSTATSGCKTDADCKGSRVCSGGSCIDPSTTGGGGGSSAAATLSDGASCTKPGTLACGQSSGGSQDGTILYCGTTAWMKVFQCPGLQACSITNTSDSAICGTDTFKTYYAKSGGPCAAENAAACSFDQKVVAECKAGKWVDAIHCPPTECQHKTDQTTGKDYTACANDGYTVGDMCSFSAGSVNCSTDLTKILQCANGTTVLHQDCAAAGQKCTSVGVNTIGCQ